MNDGVDGVPLSADVLENGEVRFRDGGPVIARGGQGKRIPHVERLNLPVSLACLASAEGRSEHP